jgi:hypothetical protein
MSYNMSIHIGEKSKQSNPVFNISPHIQSEWLLFNTNSAIFQLYHGKKKLIFYEITMIFIVLAHWNNSLRIDMLPHLDTLSWFRANHSALSPKCYILSREATNTNFIVFCLTWSWLEPTINHTRGEHANPHIQQKLVNNKNDNSTFICNVIYCIYSHPLPKFTYSLTHMHTQIITM